MCNMVSLARDVAKYAFSGNFNRFDTLVVMPVVSALAITGYLFFAVVFVVIGAVTSVIGEVLTEK